MEPWFAKFAGLPTKETVHTFMRDEERWVCFLDTACAVSMPEEAAGDLSNWQTKPLLSWRGLWSGDPIFPRYSRDELFRFIPPAWWPPENPCSACGGTAVSGGTYESEIARLGFMEAQGPCIDLNRVSRVIEVMDGPHVEISSPRGQFARTSQTRFSGTRGGFPLLAVIAAYQSDCKASTDNCFELWRQ